MANNSPLVLKYTGNVGFYEGEPIVNAVNRITRMTPDARVRFGPVLDAIIKLNRYYRTYLQTQTDATDPKLAKWQESAKTVPKKGTIEQNATKAGWFVGQFKDMLEESLSKKQIAQTLVKTAEKIDENQQYIKFLQNFLSIPGLPGYFTAQVDNFLDVWNRQLPVHVQEFISALPSDYVLTKTLQKCFQPDAGDEKYAMRTLLRTACSAHIALQIFKPFLQKYIPDFIETADDVLLEVISLSSFMYGFSIALQQNPPFGETECDYLGTSITHTHYLATLRDVFLERSIGISKTFLLGDTIQCVIAYHPEWIDGYKQITGITNDNQNI